MTRRRKMAVTIPLFLGSLVAGASAEGRRDAKAPPACKLSAGELAGRGDVIRQIREGVESTRELEDGYEFTFPGTDEWARRLSEFVAFERGCCSFLQFQLTFEPDEGPIRLALRGADGVKALIEALAGP